jgi:hypothetical protein
MLGCHEFCGYYEWTFSYARQNWGPDAFTLLMHHAIGLDSQKHYLDAARANGIKGLHDTWFKTAGEEGGDWAIQFDEARKVLRFDIHRCPSKGFLLSSDRMQDEDYCDHCMGWVAPAMHSVGFEVTKHEHNHCGQCVWQIEPRGQHTEPQTYKGDIHQSPLWSGGYVEQWVRQVKLPVLPSVSPSTDWTEVLTTWFAPARRLVMIARGPSARDARVNVQDGDMVVVADPTYAYRDTFSGEPHAVLIGDNSCCLEAVAKRYHATPPQRRPLLLYSYLPANIWDRAGAFVPLDLPRPLPILPLLLRRNLYRHEPGAAYPTSGVFLALLAAALGKPALVAGIDLYRHPSGQQYLEGSPPAAQPAADAPVQWPAHHSEACDVAHARRAHRHAAGRIEFVGVIEQMLQAQEAAV